MKKINKKGFTLIELLAVITIMGILMLVSIPAVSRTIENTRRNTFLNTAKTYINAVKNAVAADELYLSGAPISSLAQGYYYYGIDTSTGDTATDLVEQGGKSSWGNANVKGYVAIYKTVTAGAEGRTKYEYAIYLVDAAGRGIKTLTKETELVRSSVSTSGGTYNHAAPTNTDNDKFSTVKLNNNASSGNCKLLTIG